MADTKVEKIFLSSSPHFTAGLSTQKIMLCVLIALLPECICAVVLFGLNAFLAISVSVASCVLFEYLYQKITKQKIVIKNLSACVTGLMLALVCPPTIPLWQIILGDLIAIIVAKGLFGGIGSNVFNPALTGRAFMFISFPVTMGSTWQLPKSVIEASSGATPIDAITSATVLSQLKSGNMEVNSNLLNSLFFGTRAGCMGETSILLILISFLFLLAIRIIDWRAPLAMILTVAISSFISYFAEGMNISQIPINILVDLMTGGLLFGAVFMVTDYATSPVTKPGRLLFGFGCGIITFLIRKFGSYPEGVMFSILIMNCLVPFLNNITNRKYGYGKKANRKPVKAKIVQDFDIKNAQKEESK